MATVEVNGLSGPIVVRENAENVLSAVHQALGLAQKFVQLTLPDERGQVGVIAANVVLVED